MDQKAVGHRIQQMRIKCGLTQEQLGEAIGVSASHISVIERGVKATKVDNLVAIANTLKVGSDELLLDVLDHVLKQETTELHLLIEALPLGKRALALKLVRLVVMAIEED